MPVSDFQSGNMFYKWMTKSEFLRVQRVLQTTYSCVSDCRAGLMANLETALLSAQLSCQSTRSLLVNNFCCCKLCDLQNTDDMLIDIYCWWVQIQVHHTRRRSASRAIKCALALKANSWTAISTYSESLFPLSKRSLLSSKVTRPCSNSPTLVLPAVQIAWHYRWEPSRPLYHHPIKSPVANDALVPFHMTTFRNLPAVERLNTLRAALGFSLEIISDIRWNKAVWISAWSADTLNRALYEREVKVESSECTWIDMQSPPTHPFTAKNNASPCPKAS